MCLGDWVGNLLRGQPANPGSPGKCVKTVCVGRGLGGGTGQEKGSGLYVKFEAVKCGSFVCALVDITACSCALILGVAVVVVVVA